MIHNIWVIDRTSGRCLFEKTYDKTAPEPDVIPAFLSALTSLSDLGLKGDRVSVVETKGKKWVYRYSDPLIFVVTGAKTDPESHLKAQVAYLGNAFLELFPKLKGESGDKFMKNWSGAPADFRGFEGLVDQLVQQWQKIGDINKAAKALDVLEIYQRVFDAIFMNVPQHSGRIWADLREAVSDFCEKCRVNVRYSLSEPNPVLDLLSVDAFSANYENLKAGLAILLTRLIESLKKQLPAGQADSIIHAKVIPIMKRDWRRIDIYGIDRVLVSLL